MLRCCGISEGSTQDLEGTIMKALVDLRMGAYEGCPNVVVTVMMTQAA